jgi:hypothetical protein
VLAALNLAMFWAPLTGDGVLSDVPAVFADQPFKGYAPHDLHAFYNPWLADNAHEYVPWQGFARGSLRAGVLPQWDPYVLSGAPVLANPQSSLFTPLNLPVWILPFNYGIGFASVLKLWLAGLGAFLLGRRLGLGFWPSLVVGVAFGWAPFLIVWNQLDTVTNVWAVFPWVMLAAECVCDGGGPAAGVGLVAASAVALAGGHPGSQIHVYTGVLVYTGVRLALARGVSRRRRLVRAAAVLVAMGLAVMVTAVALLPAWLLIPGSASAHIEQSGGAVRSLSSLRTLLFPDWWGRPSALSVPSPANFTEETFYVGTAPLLLALVAMTTRVDWRRKAPFAVLAVLGLAVPLGVPPVHTLFADVAPWSHVRNSRMIALDDFGLDVLAGFGARDLLAGEARRRAWAVVGAGLLAGVVAAAAIGPDGESLHRLSQHFLHGVSYASAPVLALTSVVWWTLFALALGLVFVIARRAGPLAPLLLVAVVAADLGHFLDGYQPVAPARDVYGFTPASIAFVQSHVGHFRATGLGYDLLADISIPYRIRDMGGYDPPLPDRAYWAFLDDPRVPFNIHLFVPSVTARNRRALDDLGVRYVFAARPATAPRQPGFRLVYRGRDGRVYENLRARPRAFVVGGAGTVRFTHDGDQVVALRASMRTAGRVVLADRYAPGWSVTVDGRPARPRRYDSVIRSVRVPAGTHTVIWRYETPGLRAGAAISTLGIVLSGLWVVAPAVRRKHPSVRRSRRSPVV